MSLTLRHNNFNKTKSIFKIKDNYCLTYLDAKIRDKIDSYDIDKIGEGAKGKIYKLTDSKKEVSLAIKIMLIDQYNLKKSLFSPRWREVELLLDFTKDVQENKIRNLPLCFGYQVCSVKDYNSIVVYYEYFEDILKNWLVEKRSDDEWISLILQILITIKYLREKFMLTHNDLTWVNIMFNSVKRGGYWKYETNEFNLFVPNLGYEFIFWDFGSSKSYKFPQRKHEKEILDRDFNGKKDQKYILDICKRIKMNHLINRYSLDELKQHFLDGDAKKYYDIIFKEETERFKRYNDNSRFNYVISKNLAFYLVEIGKYTELYNNRPINKYNIEDDVELPSSEIEERLQNIVDNDLESEIDIILKKYFSEFINKSVNVKAEDTYNLKI